MCMKVTTNDSLSPFIPLEVSVHLFSFMLVSAPGSVVLGHQAAEHGHYVPLCQWANRASLLGLLAPCLPLKPLFFEDWSLFSSPSSLNWTLFSWPYSWHVEVSWLGSDPSHSSNNAGSSTWWAARELLNWALDWEQMRSSFWEWLTQNRTSHSGIKLCY